MQRRAEEVSGSDRRNCERVSGESEEPSDLYRIGEGRILSAAPGRASQRGENFECIRLGDGMESLNPEENVHAGLVGTAVDYLTRFITGTPAAEAFQFSLLGFLPVEDGLKKALELVRTVQGLEDSLSAVR